MSSVGIKTDTDPTPEVQPVDMKLEVVLLSVSDVDRAKAFYESLGWRLDIDVAAGAFRGVQMTPHNSEASIIFGNAVRPAAPKLVLAVRDIDAARNDLIARGIDVGEVFHFAGGPFNDTLENPRVPGRDPEGRSYFTFAAFDDPDGNGWLLQEIVQRAPGREWEASTTNVASLADLLRETAEHHDRFEKTHAKHHWADWYASYLSARQNGSSSDEASATADRYMEEEFHILPT